MTRPRTAQLRGPRNGGVAARRALVRWAWRMFRREWRQQVLVVALLTVAVAAAVGSITIVYNTTPSDNAKFGRPTRSSSSTPPTRASSRRISRPRRSGSGRPMSSPDLRPRPRRRRPGVLPGSRPARRLRPRALSLRHGRYPTRPDEVAVTDGVAELCDSRSGRPSRSTAAGGRWSASSRTDASSATSSLSSPPRRRSPALRHRPRRREWTTRRSNPSPFAGRTAARPSGARAR